MSQHINAAPTPPRFKNPEIWSTLESLILSLLEKNPTRRPASGNVVALALFEEAERARRLERINPGAQAIGLRGARSTRRRRARVTVGGLSAEPTPANGTGRVDAGTAVRRDRRPPLRRFPGTSDTAGSPPCLPEICSSRSGPAADRAGVVQPPGRPRDAHEDARHADRHHARRALSLRSLPGVPPGRLAAAGDLPPAAARREERGPRAAPAGDDLAVVRRADPGGDRARKRHCSKTAPTSAPRSAPSW